MKHYLRTHTNPPVFLISGILVVAFVVWGVVAPENVAAVADQVQQIITTDSKWLDILAAAGAAGFGVWLMFSRYARIRLGPAAAKPEYRPPGRSARLFTAGLGLGLVFFAVSEPVSHFTAPPTGEAGTVEASRNAMNYVFYHWGLHPWAIYIVVGLSLGYFAFRRGLPLRPASALYPLIGERIYG